MKNRSILLAVILLSLVSFPLYGDDIPDDVLLQLRIDRKNKVIGIDYFGPAKWLASLADVEHPPTVITGAKEFFLRQHELSIGEVRFIASLKAVERLQVGVLPDPIKVSTKMVEVISDMHSLQSLSFNVDQSSQVRWKKLGALPNLESLQIAGDVEFRASDLEAFSSLHTLQSLHLIGSFQESKVDWLSRLNQLVVVEIASDELTPSLVDAIAKLKSLEILRVTGSQFGFEHIKRLCQNSGQSMMSLKIEVNDRTVLNYISEFSSLKFLELDLGNQVFSIDASVFKGLRQLDGLRIRGKLDKASAIALSNELSLSVLDLETKE